MQIMASLSDLEILTMHFSYVCTDINLIFTHQPHVHAFTFPGEVWCASSERHPSAGFYAWQPKQRGQFGFVLLGFLLLLYFCQKCVMLADSMWLWQGLGDVVYFLCNPETIYWPEMRTRWVWDEAVTSNGWGIGASITYPDFSLSNPGSQHLR